MLYALCKQYLIDKLKEAGIKTRPYTTRKALEKCMESHVGAVIFERETNVRNGSKKDLQTNRERSTNGGKSSTGISLSASLSASIPMMRRKRFSSGSFPFWMLDFTWTVIL